MCFASHFLWYTLISLVYIFLEGREENYPNTAWVQLNSGHTLCGATRHEERHCPRRFASAYRLRCSRPAFYSLPTQGTGSTSAYCLNKTGGKSWEIRISHSSLNALLRYPENLKELWIIATKRPTESPLIVFGNKGDISNICVTANRQRAMSGKKAEEVS